VKSQATCSRAGLSLGGDSPLPQHEEPVLGEHRRDRREPVVEDIEPGDEDLRIAEPCREGVGGVARDDVVAAAFDDREAWRQEPLDAGPREEAAVLVDGMAEPGVESPDEAFDPRGAVIQMEDEQRAAGNSFRENRLPSRFSRFSPPRKPVPVTDFRQVAS